MAQSRRPVWWRWEIELTSHVRRRMADRGFDEIDLRTMLDAASSVRADVQPRRWRVLTRLDGRRWVVIVEPDADATTVIVVTAFGVD